MCTRIRPVSAFSDPTFRTVPASARLLSALLAVTPCAALAACGQNDSAARLGTVTPKGRVFTQDDFSITVPLRFTADTASIGGTRSRAEHAGLRESQVETIVTLNERAIQSGILRIVLFDGTSSNYERADLICVYSFPSGYFARSDQVIADQRLAIWLDEEPLKWERVVVNDRKVDRLRIRSPKFGTESVRYYLDNGETAHVVCFQTAPERAEKFFAETEEIMKRFVPR